jgi:hypothetical protein
MAAHPCAGALGDLVALAGPDRLVEVVPLGGSGGGRATAVVATRHAPTSMAWLALDSDGAGAQAHGLLVGTEDGGVAAYDLRALRAEPGGAGGERRITRAVGEVARHAAAVHALAVTSAAGGALLCASGGDDGRALVHEIVGGGARGSAVGGLPAQRDFVRALAWLPGADGGAAALVTGCWDGTVRMHAV